MSDTATAEIIMFPGRRGAVPVPSVTVSAPAADETAVGSAVADDEAQARLARALEKLNLALAEQRKAVAAWRGALSELSTTMQGLNGSVHRYRSTLAALDGKVGNLRSEATRLEQWADNALAGKTSPTSVR